jgi:hypothetical protein
VERAEYKGPRHQRQAAHVRFNHVTKTGSVEGVGDLEFVKTVEAGRTYELEAHTLLRLVDDDGVTQGPCPPPLAPTDKGLSKRIRGHFS